SLCGEHLSQDNMNRAIQMLEENLNIEVREFAVAGIKYNSMFAHKWYIGTDNHIDENIVKGKIDEYLKTLNDDYRVERIAAIKELFIEILPPEVFYDWLKLKGKEGAQNKFPRVLKNEKLNDWEDFIKEYKKNIK
ncbi:MAG: GH3 auxin-responsive promoter family protein, partial [Bacteroidetes bacterium]|nr:GH3 auxin-responsive promoter family protein [Bacteroidota bacterium]